MIRSSLTRCENRYEFKFEKIAVILLFLCQSLTSHSQIVDFAKCSETVKLYMSYTDYANNDYVDSICLSDRNSKFSIFYNKVTIKKGKEKYKYSNGSLWGFQKGSDLYRYFESKETFGTYGYHKVLDQEGLVIYSKKESGGYRMSSTSTIYFYSINLDAPLKKLRIENLEKDFSNPLFIKEVKKLQTLFELNSQKGLKLNVIFKKYYK